MSAQGRCDLPVAMKLRPHLREAESDISCRRYSARPFPAHFIRLWAAFPPSGCACLVDFGNRLRTVHKCDKEECSA
jgi:hypothetical protein